jgi:hypothetical protein
MKLNVCKIPNTEQGEETGEILKASQRVGVQIDGARKVKLMTHAEHHRVMFSKNEGLIFKEFSGLIKADQLSRLPNGDFDFESAIKEFASSQMKFGKRLQGLFPFQKGPRVIQNQGNIFIKFEEDVYTIMTGEENKDPITGRRGIIFIHPRFSSFGDRVDKGGHYGLGRNQVYAPTMLIAYRKLTELSLWKVLEHDLIKGYKYLGVEAKIDPDLESQKPHNIAEWRRRNKQKAVILGGVFYRWAREEEALFAIFFKARGSSIEKMIKYGFIFPYYYLRAGRSLSFFLDRLNEVNSIEKIREHFVNIEDELPTERMSFSEMLKRFDRRDSPGGDIVALSDRPKADELGNVRDIERGVVVVTFEIEFFQRKKDRRWYAVKGEVGKTMLRAHSRVNNLLASYGDLSRSLHLHPPIFEEDPNQFDPPSAEDLTSLLYNRVNVHAVVDRANVYVISAGTAEEKLKSEGKSFRGIMLEIRNKWGEIMVKDNDSEIAHTKFLTDYQEYIISLGFEFEIYKREYFKENEDEVYAAMEDTTPIIINPDDIIGTQCGSYSPLFSVT